MINPVPTSSDIGTFRDASVTLTSVWRGWFSAIFNILFRTQNYGVIDYYAPAASGFSHATPQSVGVLLLQPAAAYAAGTVILPTDPFPSQQVRIVSSQDITALTLLAAGAETILNAPTTLAAGVGVAYIYRDTTTTWHRLY